MEVAVATGVVRILIWVIVGGVLLRRRAWLPGVACLLAGVASLMGVIVLGSPGSGLRDVNGLLATPLVGVICFIFLKRSEWKA